MVQVGPLLFSIGQRSQLIIVKKFIIFSKSWKCITSGDEIVILLITKLKGWYRLDGRSSYWQLIFYESRKSIIDPRDSLFSIKKKTRIYRPKACYNFNLNVPKHRRLREATRENNFNISVGITSKEWEGKGEKQKDFRFVHHDSYVQRITTSYELQVAN